MNFHKTILALVFFLSTLPVFSEDATTPENTSPETAEVKPADSQSAPAEASPGAESAASEKPEKSSELALMYIERSKQREKDDNKEGAEADYQKAHLFDPKLAEKMRPDMNPGMKAEEWILRGDKSLMYLEALECYDKAIKLNPSSSNAYFKKAKLLFKNDHYVNAIEAFNKTIELDPTNSKAYLFRAKAKKAAGDQAGYAADLKEYKQVKKRNWF